MPRRDILFRLRGEDDLSPALRRATGSARELERELDDIDTNINVDVDVDTAGIEHAQREVAELDDDLSGLAGGGGGFSVGGVAGVAGLVTGLLGIATASADATIELDNLSRSTGLSRDLLQDMSRVVEPLGGEVDDVAEAFKTMAERLQEAERGEETALEFFDALNLDVSELQGLTPDELFIRITDALINIEDPVLRAATANAIFGRDLDDVLVAADRLGGGINDLRRQFDDDPPITDSDVQAALDYKQNLDDLRTSFEELARSVVADINPFVQGVTDLLNDPIGAIRATFTEPNQGLPEGFEIEEDPTGNQLGSVVGSFVNEQNRIRRGISGFGGFQNIIDASGQRNERQAFLRELQERRDRDRERREARERAAGQRDQLSIEELIAQQQAGQAVQIDNRLFINGKEVTSETNAENDATSRR